MKACKKNTHIEQNYFYLKHSLCDAWLFTYCSILLSCSDSLTNEMWYDYERWSGGGSYGLFYYSSILLCSLKETFKPRSLFRLWLWKI